MASAAGRAAARGTQGIRGRISSWMNANADRSKWEANRTGGRSRPMPPGGYTGNLNPPGADPNRHGGTGGDSNQPLRDGPVSMDQDVNG